MKKSFYTFVAALAIAAAPCSVVAAGAYNNFFFFGDSLSDTGNNIAGGAPITNPPGTLWVNNLNSAYGIPVTPGGNNFAYAGATTGSGVTNILYQINNQYLANRAVDNNAFYFIWGGANDLFNAPAATTIPVAVSNLSTGVNQLQGAGARYVMILNLPDLGKTPGVMSLGPDTSAAFSALTVGFNNTLATQLDQSGANVIQADIYSVFNSVIANPGKYGFTNVTDQWILSTGQNPNNYLFFNAIHPTVAGQKLVSDYVQSILQGPRIAAVLAEAPIDVANTQYTALGNELNDVRWGTLQGRVGCVQAFANANYGEGRESGIALQSAGFNSYRSTLLAGVKYRASENAVVGAAIGNTWNRVNFVQSIGSVDITQNMFSLFGGYQAGRGYLMGMLSTGLIDYNNYQRNIQLGAAQDVARSATKGTQWGGKAEAGYRLFDGPSLKSGPLASMTYQSISVDAFGESGATWGTNLQYGRQNNTSFITSIGWQMSYTKQLDRFQLIPYGQLTYNKEWLRKDREIQTSLVSLSNRGAFLPATSGYNNRTWGFIDVGISGRFRNGVMTTLGYQSTLFLQRGRYNSVMLSVSVPLN